MAIHHYKLFALYFVLFHSLVTPFSISGAEYRDLEYADTYFNAELADWATSFYTKSTICGSYYMLGGYDAWAPGGWVERTYTNVPSHDTVYITFILYRMDSWDNNQDYMDIYIDSTFITHLSNMGYSGMPSYCGNGGNTYSGYGDAMGVRIIMVQPHSSSSFKFTMYSRCSEDAKNESPGLKDFTVVFKNASTSSGPEATLLWSQDGASPPSESQYQTCSGGRYRSGGSCPTCDSSCALCFGGTTQDCFRCNNNYFYSANQCRKCHSTCRTCKDSSSIGCTSCYSSGNIYLYPDGSCRSSCTLATSYGGPPYKCSCSVGQFFYNDSTCGWCSSSPWVQSGNICLGPCWQNNGYYYNNGSCLLTCNDFGFNTRQTTGNWFCDFKCSSSDFLYQDGTCASTCPFPYTSYTISGQYKFCNFPCSSSLFYYANRTCLTGCNSPFNPVTTATSKICNFPCAQDQYYYSDTTCGTSCPSPFTIYNVTVGAFCFFPCSNSEFYFSNGTCGTSCPSPYTVQTSSLYRYCNFPCTQYQYYYQNGSCLSSCISPFNAIVSGLAKFCNFPCQQNQYRYANGTCSTICNTAIHFTAVNISVGGYCFFACKTNEYYYMNGSCIRSCSSPFIAVNVSVGGFCHFPCAQNQYRYANGTCSTICPGWPFSAVNVSVGGYCNFVCNRDKYYYINGSCFSTCLSPFTALNISVGAYCNFPCRQNEYRYTNGTCSTICPSSSPFTAVNISVGGYCNFKCGRTQYYYVNGSCLNTCAYPMSSVNISISAYCNFPCQRNQFWYINGSCLSTCPSFPFSAVNVSVGGYCNFFCAQNRYYFSNNTCLSSCPSPFRASNVSVGGICTFPCARNEYWFSNGTCSTRCPTLGFAGLNVSVGGICTFLCPSDKFYYINESCLSTCPSEFISSNFSVGGICQFPCRRDQYWIANNTCSDFCPVYPYIARNISIGGYCTFACPQNLYYFTNNTCLSFCPSRMIARNVSIGAFCEFPGTCGRDLYLYQNGSCLPTCPEDYFTSSNYSVGAFCDFKCPVNTFYYQNLSCLETCPSPLILTNISVGGICTYRCESSNLFYFPQRDSCSPFCPATFPFTSENISVGAYCYFTCTQSEYFYKNGSCLSTCPSPLVSYNVTTGAFCEFPCASGLVYYLSNSTCASSCVQPFISVNISIGIYCVEPEPEVTTLANNTFKASVITTVAVTGPLLLMGGDPYSASMTMSALQSVNFAMYYNVEYSGELTGVLQSAGDIGMMRFIPNPFTWFGSVEKSGSRILSESGIPDKFSKGGYKTLFFANQGKLIFIGSLIGIVFLLAVILDKVMGITSIISSGSLNLSYGIPNLLVRIFLLFYVDIIISSWIQVLNMSADTNLEFASSIFGVIVLVICFAFPLLAAKNLSVDNKVANVKKPYEAFTEDFDMTLASRRYFIVIVITKRFIDTTALVVLYDSPVMQIFIPWMTNTIMLYAIIKIQPHHDMVLNFFEGIRELGFFVMHFSIITLAFNDKVGKENTYFKNVVSWTLLGGIGVTMFFAMANVWRENIYTGVAIYKKLSASLNPTNQKYRNYKVSPEIMPNPENVEIKQKQKPRNQSSAKIGIAPRFEVRKVHE